MSEIEPCPRCGCEESYQVPVVPHKEPFRRCEGCGLLCQDAAWNALSDRLAAADKMEEAVETADYDLSGQNQLMTGFDHRTYKTADDYKIAIGQARVLLQYAIATYRAAKEGGGDA